MECKKDKSFGGKGKTKFVRGTEVAEKTFRRQIHDRYFLVRNFSALGPFNSPSLPLESYFNR
jgi:hypothetical protein